MTRNAIAPAILAGILLGLGACSEMRSSRTSTPPAPAGPVQTTSTAGNLIPAGTVIPIRTSEAIRTTTEGSVFRAEVAQDIVNRDYQVVVRRGSPAALVVVRSDRGGAVGTPEIELALRSLTVNGRTYTVNSEGTVQSGREGLGRNERTATMVGGGAVLGTVIGAIAGGAGGAAIGAAVGAAGGAATQVLTRGKEVSVPAETVLSIQLRDQITLSD